MKIKVIFKDGSEIILSCVNGYSIQNSLKGDVFKVSFGNRQPKTYKNVRSVTELFNELN